MRPLLPTPKAVVMPSCIAPSMQQTTSASGGPTYPPLMANTLPPHSIQNELFGIGLAGSSSSPFFSHVSRPFSTPFVQPLQTTSHNMFEFPPVHSPMYGFLPSHISGNPSSVGDSSTQSSLPVAQRGPTVYLGHLTQDTDDMIIRQLLQECGRVVRWSRTTDPATKKLSSFGFCEFESPLGVMRAVRCLNGLILDGHALVANCEDKVKDGLDQWRRDRKNKLQEENPSKSIQEIEMDIEREELRIQQTTQKVASDWNVRIADSKATAEKPSEEQVPQQPEPPPTTPTENTAEQATLSIQNQQDASRAKWFESLVGYVELPPSLANSLSTRSVARIRLCNNRIKEARIDFRKRMQAWERKEVYLARERKKRREETEAMLRNPVVVLSANQRRRLAELDRKDAVYCLSLDGAIWEGELSSRRQEDRAERLDRERVWDQEDIEAERREVEENLMRQEKEKRRVQEELERKEQLEREEQQEKAERMKLEEMERRKQDLLAEEAPVESKTENLDKRDLTATPSSLETSPQSAAVTPIAPIKISLATNFPKKIEPLTTVDTPIASNLFLTAEDEEDQDSRHMRHAPLVKIDMPLHRDNRVLNEIDGRKSHSAANIVLEIAALVPKSNDDLFEYTIDWNLLADNRVFEGKVSPWINKKVVEFLGEEEPEVVAFITAKLKLAPKAIDLINELRDFFDEDAEGFIAKLWKLLVFEDLRLKRSQQ